MDIVDDLRKDPYEEEQQYKREARLELGGILERAADEIERLRKALTQVVVYYEGFTLTIEEVVADARAALKGGE